MSADIFPLPLPSHLRGIRPRVFSDGKSVKQKAIWIYCLFLFLLNPAFSFSSAIQSELRPAYFLNANARECVIEVRLNDIPVLRIDTADPNSPHAAAFPVSSCIVKGINKLHLLVLNTHEGSGAPDARAWITDSGPQGGIVKSPHASDPGVVVLAEWMSSSRDTKFPKTIEVNKDFGQALAESLWEKAPQLTLDDATRKKVGAFLAAVRNALMKGDANAVVSYEQPAILEVARTSGWSPKEVENMTRDMAKTWMKRHGALAALNPAEWDFHLVAGGRLIECVNKDGRPTLRTASPDPLGLSGITIFIGLDRGQMRTYIRG